MENDKTKSTRPAKEPKPMISIETPTRVVFIQIAAIARMEYTVGENNGELMIYNSAGQTLQVVFDEQAQDIYNWFVTTQTAKSF